MARLRCPKCDEELDQIIRLIEARCRYHQEKDDYLNETNGERFIDICPTCRTELEIY